MNEAKSGKYIKQIRLAGNKNYFPNKYYSPYDFMDKLNEALEKRYDLKVIEVRYMISKSKAIKDLDQTFSLGNIAPDNTYNNIFDIEDQFMKNQLLHDIIELMPPKDFEPSKFEEDIEQAKKKEEDKKILQIDASINLLNYYLKDAYKGEYRSLKKFKMQLNQNLKQSQVDVLIKVVLTKPVEDLLESDKNSKNPVIVTSTGKQQIRVFLHPINSDNQSIELLAKLCGVTDWSLCAMLAQDKKNQTGITYWSINELQKRIVKTNQSIKTMSYIAIHKNKRGQLDSIDFYAFLFNQIVFKASVSTAQIRKIQMHKDADQFYLHLAYPPKYFMAILKPDLGCHDGFIRNWQRVQNFMFLRNQDIMKDQFFRLFLFNNSVLKVRLSQKQSPTIRLQNARGQLLRVSNHFTGSIQYNKLDRPYDFNSKLTRFNTFFKYQSFKNKFTVMSTCSADKIWKIKYLILVLVRYNWLIPSEIDKLMEYIDGAKEDIDIFIYIFWQSVVATGMVGPEIKDQTYLPYLEKQYQEIKKLRIDQITRKVSSNDQKISYVFKASLTPSGYLYNPPTPEMKGRLMKEYSDHSQHFIRVAMSDDNEGTLKNQKYITKGALKKLMNTIKIIDREYVPLGWSPSQLRAYSLWYIHPFQTKQFRLTREQVLSFLGNFDKIFNAAKKAARIGQAFSASWTYLCKKGQIKEVDIPDVRSNKNYLFTDGIGKISQNLIQKIGLKLQIRDLSILQVRYKGAKGLLVMDKKLGKNQIHLRPSMVKYECEHQAAAKYLDILDWNKYKAGFLNRQTIVLLKSLGISDKVFQKLQADHIQRINNLSFKDCSIFKHMNEDLNTDINNLEPANMTILQLLRAGFKLQNEPFFRGVLETMKKNGYHQLKIKSNILIKKSARIIGIIDEYNVLEEGQLYCTVYDELSLSPQPEHVEGDVIITRNPCLHPADFRKMKCVGPHQIARRFEERGQQNIFSQFVNCIIFPMKGDIPVTAQISGSDLDGDNFFICWQPTLIFKQDENIYIIDAPTDQNQNTVAVDPAKKSPGYEQMLNFFVEYLNYQKLGQIDNSHLVKADRSSFYAKDAECLQLAVIHGKAVDFPKTGFCPQVNPRLLVSCYPDFMEKQESPEYISQSILGNLYRDIKDRIQNLLKDCQTQKTGKIDDQLIKQLFLDNQNAINCNFDDDQIKQVLKILLNYERQLAGLISLVGVDTEYQIYSGNFSIAKDKVKNFGKNRLVSTILAMRSKYFQDFFSCLPHQQKQRYEDARQNELDGQNLFLPITRKRAMLFYICSYITKFYEDEQFLSESHILPLKKQIAEMYNCLTLNKTSNFCGFVWFVVPKIVINQKYYMKKINTRKFLKQQGGENNENEVPQYDDDEEVI